MGPTFERWLWEKRGNFELLPFGSRLEFRDKEVCNRFGRWNLRKLSLCWRVWSYGDARYFINACKKCWDGTCDTFITINSSPTDNISHQSVGIIFSARETFDDDRVSPIEQTWVQLACPRLLELEDALINLCKQCNGGGLKSRVWGNTGSGEGQLALNGFICIALSSARWKQWHDKVSLELLTMWRKSSVSQRGCASTAVFTTGVASLSEQVFFALSEMRRWVGLSTRGIYS